MSVENKAIFEHRFEILKMEIEIIEGTIRKIDDIGNNVKKWAILTWGGSIAIMLQEDALRPFLLASAVLPVVFLIVDARWRIIQRHFVFRMQKVSDFINSAAFKNATETGDFGSFTLLDPFGRSHEGDIEFKRFSSFFHVVRFETVSWIYIGLVTLSILFTILIRVFP